MVKFIYLAGKKDNQILQDENIFLHSGFSNCLAITAFITAA
jgi:hypothetical protein